MAPELEIMNRQKVIIVHNMGKMGGPFRAHFALLVVKFSHFLVEPAPALLYGFQVDYIVWEASDLWQ